MLNITELKAFIPTLDLGRAKLFYTSILDLNLVSEDNFGIEFDFNGSKIRVTKVQDFKPHVFTILGWNIKDIESAIKQLNLKSVFCEKFEFLDQDNLGIWIAPGGTKVAWFKDTALVKFGTLISPGTKQIDYDTFYVGEPGEDHIHCYGLKCGNYFGILSPM